MRRSLPPLNAVKAFESAGRHVSLSAAAAELGVTHGAISRQIGILEDWFGVRLFAKEGRGVSLTAEGQRFLEEATHLFDGLAAASDNLSGRKGRRLLRISASQTFTMRWLISRLPAFTTAQPDIEVRLSASIDPIDKLGELFDIVIRRGAIGTTSTPFLSETCLPVASPKLLEARPIRQVADLSEQTLLHAESVAELWPRWLENAGFPGFKGKAHLRFDPLYHSLQAALDGAGIAMGPSALVASDVAAGRLVALFPQLPLPMDDFHVFLSPACHSSRHARLFLRWLIDEGKSSNSAA